MMKNSQKINISINTYSHQGILNYKHMDVHSLSSNQSLSSLENYQWLIFAISAIQTFFTSNEVYNPLMKVRECVPNCITKFYLKLKNWEIVELYDHLDLKGNLCESW